MIASFVRSRALPFIFWVPWAFLQLQWAVQMEHQSLLVGSTPHQPSAPGPHYGSRECSLNWQRQWTTDCDAIYVAMRPWLSSFAPMAARCRFARYMYQIKMRSACDASWRNDGRQASYISLQMLNREWRAFHNFKQGGRPSREAPRELHGCVPTG
jgi:hypothetical protein